MESPEFTFGTDEWLINIHPGMLSEDRTIAYPTREAAAAAQNAFCEQGINSQLVHHYMAERLEDVIWMPGRLKSVSA